VEYTASMVHLCTLNTGCSVGSSVTLITQASYRSWKSLDSGKSWNLK